MPFDDLAFAELPPVSRIAGRCDVSRSGAGACPVCGVALAVVAVADPGVAAWV